MKKLSIAQKNECWVTHLQNIFEGVDGWSIQSLICNGIAFVTVDLILWMDRMMWFEFEIFRNLIFMQMLGNFIKYILIGLVTFFTADSNICSQFQRFKRIISKCYLSQIYSLTSHHWHSEFSEWIQRCFIFSSIQSRGTIWLILCHYFFSWTFHIKRGDEKNPAIHRL